MTTSIVTSKVQAEHPNWKLTDRRVNKFVKRFMDNHKNPAGADDDQTASMYKKGGSKRGLFGIFSPSKKNIVTEPEPIQETTETPSSTTPKSDAPPTPDPKSPDAASQDPSLPGSPENEQVVAEVPSKDIAYEQDNSVVDSPQDCWGLGSNCSVM